MTENQNRVEYGVVLDDQGSTDTYDTEAEAREHATAESPIVRIVTTPIDEPYVQPPTREQIAGARVLRPPFTDGRCHCGHAVSSHNALGYCQVYGNRAPTTGDCICESYEDARNVAWRAGRDAVLALFQQPAPTAEPVSIADMAPGTTFTARHVDPDECGGIDHRWFVIRPGARPLVISDEGQHWSGDSIDPSTICDVTPPPATPEADR